MYNTISLTVVTVLHIRYSEPITEKFVPFGLHSSITSSGNQNSILCFYEIGLFFFRFYMLVIPWHNSFCPSWVGLFHLAQCPPDLSCCCKWENFLLFVTEYYAIVHVLSHFSCVWFFATLWIVAHQAPLSIDYSRQEHWSGLPGLLPIVHIYHFFLFFHLLMDT